LQGALVTLLAPLRDQRGVQPLASQEGASLVAPPPFILSEYPQLVLRRVGPPGRAFGDLGFGLGHWLSMPAGHHCCHHHRGSSIPRALRLSIFESRPVSPNVDPEGGPAGMVLPRTAGT